MVYGYRGKPSRGCAVCRRRRVKCERQADGCENCRRKNIQCPGYRNELDLKFLDESSDVLRKYKKIPEGNDESSSKPTAPTSLTPSADQFLLSWFHRHHLLFPPACLVRSDTLLACIKALAAASYSSFVNTPASTLEASRRYINAIGSLNGALQLPKTAVLDSTLLSVLILGYYEMTLGERQPSILEWAKHVNGITALLELRGTSQLETADEKVLFLQASNVVFLACSRRALRIPAIFDRLIQECTRETKDPANPLWLSHSAHVRVLNLYSDFVHKVPDSPVAVISEALRLDEELSNIFLNIPSAWSYTVHQASDSSQLSRIFPCFHIYNNSTSALLWNAMRSERILLHWMIIRTLKKILKENPQTCQEAALVQIEKSEQTSNQLQMDILATVRQYLNSKSLGINEPAGAFGHTDQSQPLEFKSARLPTLRVSKGYNLLWTLGCVVEKGNTTLSLIARQMMHIVGESLGMKQGFALVEAIDMGLGIH